MIHRRAILIEIEKCLANYFQQKFGYTDKIDLKELNRGKNLKKSVDNQKDTQNWVPLELFSICSHYRFFSPEGEKQIQELIKKIKGHDKEILSDENFLKYDAIFASSLKIEEHELIALFNLEFEMMPTFGYMPEEEWTELLSYYSFILPDFPKLLAQYRNASS